MSILKVHNKKEEQKFTGVFVPQWIFSYLSLYILAKGVSRSELLRNILEQWIEETRTKTTNESLIDEIVYKVKLQWKLEKSLTPGLQLFVYKKKLEKELRTKGMEDKDIVEILKEME